MVYIILGKGFEPMEAIAPCDILRRGGAEVRFAGIGGTLIEGGHGISVQADCTVEQMKLADTDMVLLPGGLGGVHSILASETAMNFIRLAYEKNYLIAAICAAPTILASLHITDGRRATCYPGLEDFHDTREKEIASFNTGSFVVNIFSFFIEFDGIIHEQGLDFRVRHVFKCQLEFTDAFDYVW